MQITRTSPGHNPRAAFLHRDFTLFFVARLATVVGWQMQSLAIGYQIYALTHRPLTLGYIGLAQFLPILAFSPIAGHTADRYDRRKIVRICLVVLATCFLLLAGMTIQGNLRLPLVYALLFVVGTARSFLGPASQSLLPMIVPKEHFHNAVAWSSSGFQVATIAGPGLGGLFYHFGGPEGVYILSALMIFAGFLMFGAMKIRTGRMVVESLSWRTLLAGYDYIRTHRIVLGAMSLDLFAVLLGGVTALLPIYANDILHVGPAGLGVMRGSFAVGALVIGLAMAHLPPMRRAGATMLWCTAGFGLFTILFGVSRSYVFSTICMALLGGLDMIGVIVRQTLVQTLTPPSMLGRVNAVNLVFIGASNELGEFESGVTAAWFGPVGAVILGGIGTIAVTLIWARQFPNLRKIDKLDETVLKECERTATPKATQAA